MNTDFIITSIAEITKDWSLPDWVKFRSLNDYWTVKDGYHKRWFNKGKWYQSAYNSWLIWKFEKLKEYNDMSFAEDFGHDIPDYDMDERGSYEGTFKNITKDVTTDKAVLVTFEDGKKTWLPKSKVTFDGDSVDIPSWLYKKLKFF